MNKRFVILSCFSLLLTTMSVNAYLQDDIAVNRLSNRHLEPEKIDTHYNYQSTLRIPIRLSIVTPIKSEKEVYEGQEIKFTVQENVFYRYRAIVKKGTPCTARVETVITNGMNGIPASVILGDFKIENIDNNKISPSFEKFGLDLSLLVFPIKWALTPFPPTGSLTNFIKGGHATIKKNSIITIYYYPEWRNK